HGIGSLLGSGLNCFQNLRTLIDGVVVCIHNFCFDTKLAGHLCGGIGLFNLVIVVVGQQRYQDPESFHWLSSNEHGIQHTPGLAGWRQDVQQMFHVWKPPGGPEAVEKKRKLLTLAPRCRAVAGSGTLSKRTQAPSASGAKATTGPISKT